MLEAVLAENRALKVRDAAMQQRVLLLQRQVEGATALELREEALRQREAAVEEREQSLQLRNAELDQREADLLESRAEPRSPPPPEEVQTRATPARPRRKAAKEPTQGPVQLGLFQEPAKAWK
jgi:hypothetical protein